MNILPLLKLIISSALFLKVFISACARHVFVGGQKGVSGVLELELQMMWMLETKLRSCKE